MMTCDTAQTFKLLPAQVSAIGRVHKMQPLKQRHNLEACKATFSPLYLFHISRSEISYPTTSKREQEMSLSCERYLGSSNMIRGPLPLHKAMPGHYRLCGKF